MTGEGNKITSKHSNKPIFLVGCPRSGTTLLASRINLHSQISVTPESHFFEILNRKAFFKILKYPITEKKLRAFFSLKRIKDFGIEYDDFVDKFKKTEQTCFDVFDILMQLYLSKSKKNYWCEKTPQNLRYLKNIYDFYPTAKIICIIRDGRDVALSLSRAPWRERNLGIPCLEWNDYARDFFDAQTHYSEKNFFSLKFEDLIQTPEKELRKLCRFLEIDFEAEMLNPPKTIPDLVPAWEMDWKGNVVKHFDNNAVGRWKSTTNSFQKKLMNSIMKSNLMKLGYGCGSFERTFLEQRKFSASILFAKMLKPILEFIGRYSRFRSKKYHPF